MPRASCGGPPDRTGPRLVAGRGEHDVGIELSDDTQAGATIEHDRGVLGVDATLILDTAHEAFVAMGVDGHVVEWNAAAEELFGWTRTEANGEDLAHHNIPERLRTAHRDGLR